MTGRPPVTVTDPSGDGGPADGLDSGPPPRTLPRWVPRAAVALGVLAVLAAAVATSREPTAPAAPRAGPSSPVPGVSARVLDLPTFPHRAERVTGDEAYAATFGLLVRQDGVGGPEDGRSRTAVDLGPGPLSLLGVRGAGFELALVGDDLPEELPPPGRDGLEVPFELEARVVDCAVDVQAPRSLRLIVQHGQGLPAELPVSSDPAVVRQLDGLVRRSCRRPRG